MSETPTALETLYDAAPGEALPLPDELAAFYGSLRLPAPADRPYVTANFVSTLDGVVALGEPGLGADEISDNNREDRCLMGLLRAVADVIVIGAGTLRGFPRSLWTQATIYPPYAEVYARLRRALGKPEAPLTVIVTSRGDVDVSLPVFTTPAAPAQIVTTEAGARALQAKRPTVPVIAAGAGAYLNASEIVRAVSSKPGSHVLLECGPNLMGRFVSDRAVDELFLTLAPQVAGRLPGQAREGFVAGAAFLPRDPRWTELASLRKCGSVLFLRYRLARQP
jgi:riboflavin biosynthesis pyrimidine reductase